MWTDRNYWISFRANLRLYEYNKWPVPLKNKRSKHSVIHQSTSNLIQDHGKVPGYKLDKIQNFSSETLEA